MQTPPFKPHPLLPGGQLQTMAGQFLPQRVQLTPTSTELVPLPDGDSLLLHVNHPAQPRPGLPFVLLLHGLGGDSESRYMLRLAAKLNDLGYSVIRFNHRGCGADAERLASRIYHAGRTDDLATTLTYLARHWSGRRYLIGAFSLSGNLLLRFLGDLGDGRDYPGLAGALAVCPPVDLEACSLALAAPGNWHIDRYYTRTLVAAAHQRSKLHSRLRPPPFPRRMNLRLFDELYTAPQAGFLSRDDYYQRSSAKQVTHRIAVPTTILAAADDPVVPPAGYAAAEFSPAVHLRLEASGGHMGFIAAGVTRFGDRRWMDAAVLDWVQGF